MVSSTLKDTLTIEEILKADNVVELLSENAVTKISQQVRDDYDKDKTSCEDKISHMKIQLLLRPR